jgi:diguanylate cyclase (GGDEF)-like protein
MRSRFAAPPQVLRSCLGWVLGRLRLVAALPVAIDQRSWTVFRAVPYPTTSAPMPVQPTATPGRVAESLHPLLVAALPREELPDGENPLAAESPDGPDNQDGLNNQYGLNGPYHPNGLDGAATRLRPPALFYILAVEIACVGLGVAGGLWTAFRLVDLVTASAFLVVASAAVLADRRPGTPGRAEDRIRCGLLVQWALPVVLLLPPVYAVAAHAPLCYPARERRRIAWGFDAAVFGVAGFCASSAHLALAPAEGSYDMDALVGSSGRLGALFAAAAVYLAVSRLLRAPARLLSQRFTGPGRDGGPSAVPTAAPGSTPAHRDALHAELLGVCSAIVVAVLWTAHPLLVLAATPTALLLRRNVRHAELLHAARHDDKTGLARPNWWLEVAEAEVTRVRRAGGPLSILLADIDHFKSINDGYGYIVGDLVLTAVADALRAATRPGELVGRFGGEEFVVLLAGADLDAAAQVAERLRRKVADVVCRREGHPPLSVTVSVGVAASSDADRSLTALIERADAALKQAKKAGRNRIRLASPA